MSSKVGRWSNVSCRYHPAIDEISSIMVALLFSFMRWSVRYRRKRGHGRGAGKQFFTLTGPREMESLNVATGPWGEVPGGQAQPRRWGAKKE